METTWSTQIIIRHPERDELATLQGNLDLSLRDMSMRQLDGFFDKRWELTITAGSQEQYEEILSKIAQIQRSR